MKHWRRKIRIDVIRAIHNAGSGHPGGSLSAPDIVTALYFREMNIDPADPKKSRQGQVYSVQGTCRSRAVRGAGREGILSCQ